MFARFAQFQSWVKLGKQCLLNIDLHSLLTLPRNPLWPAAASAHPICEIALVAIEHEYTTQCTFYFIVLSPPRSQSFQRLDNCATKTPPDRFSHRGKLQCESQDFPQITLHSTIFTHHTQQGKTA